MVMCPAHLFDEKNQELLDNNPYFTLECFNENFDDIIFDHKHAANFLFNINVTPWNKIYKNSLLRENDITFPEGLDFEDNPFFYESYLKARKVSLVRDRLYFYRINRKGSFINTGNKRFFDIIPIQNLNGKIIEKIILITWIHSSILKLIQLFLAIIKLMKTTNKNFWKLLKKIYLKWILMILKN